MDKHTIASQVEKYIPCRCCLGAVRAQVQPAIIVRDRLIRDAYIMVDCRNAECEFGVQTLSWREWLTVDLCKYNAHEHRYWKVRFVEGMIAAQELPVMQMARIMQFRWELRCAPVLRRRFVLETWMSEYRGTIDQPS